MNKELIKRIVFRLMIFILSVYSIFYILLTQLVFGYANQNPNNNVKLTPFNFLIPLILTILFIIIYNVVLYFKSIKNTNLLLYVSLLASIYVIYWIIKVLNYDWDKNSLISLGTALFCVINVNLILNKNRRIINSKD